MVWEDNRIDYLRSRGYSYSTKWFLENKGRLNAIYIKERKLERSELIKRTREEVKAEMARKREEMDNRRKAEFEKHASEGLPF